MGAQFSHLVAPRDFQGLGVDALKLAESVGAVDPHMGAVKRALQAEAFENRLQMQRPAEAQHQNAQAAVDRL